LEKPVRTEERKYKNKTVCLFKNTAIQLLFAGLSAINKNSTKQHYDMPTAPFKLQGRSQGARPSPQTKYCFKFLE